MGQGDLKKLKYPLKLCENLGKAEAADEHARLVYSNLAPEDSEQIVHSSDEKIRQNYSSVNQSNDLDEYMERS